MRKILLVLLNMLTINFAICQSKKNANIVSTDIKIVVNKIDDIKDDIDSLLSKNNIITTLYYIDKTTFNIILNTDSIEYYVLLNRFRAMGFIENEKTFSDNKRDEIYKVNQEIRLLANEKMQYENLISKIDSSEQTKFFDYWEKIISIDKSISEKELSISTLISVNTNYRIDVKFTEEQVVGHEYNDLWVNMPGLEFSILITEQSKAGVSPESMIGYNLKYLVNHKKTYLLLGLYKSQKDTLKSEINEMYMFALGQDFYSRKLGRGQRKFFNLYTSFNLGVYISSSELVKSNSWFVNPFIGLELYKTKNILIDNKVGYFLPFQNNRNQRGLLYNLSLNFVF